MDLIRDPANLIELEKALRASGIPEKQRANYYNRYLENKARVKAIPMTGNFELTPFCNLDCKMCYVHLTYSQYSRDKLLTVEDWKMIIQQAYKKGMRNATLTGGECLTYPGFSDIYLYLYKCGIIPGVLTNGILINAELLNIFKQYPPRAVQVSLYGSCEDAYERVTGHRVFQKVIRNLELLKQSDIPVKITITPNSYMREDINPLLKLLSSLSIPSNVNANLIPPRKNTGRVVHDLTIDEYVQIYKTKSSSSVDTLTPIDITELPDENRAASPRYGLICGAGRSSFGVKYNGELCPCLSLDDFGVDLLHHSFEEAWKQANTYACNYPLPVECGECIYMGRCLPCIAMHKNSPNPGHCDPRICERTKKLIAAGFISLPEKE